LNKASELFWRSAMLGTVACSVLLVGIGVSTVNGLAGAMVCLSSVFPFYLSWKSNIEYRKFE